MFDISVRLKPLSIEEQEPEEPILKTTLQPSKKQNNRRSKSTAYQSKKNFYKQKKINLSGEGSFEVSKNKLSVKTDKNFYEYTFNKVFNDDCPNREVYKAMIKKDLRKVLQGKWLTVMTYGTSGSGKTFTIFGDSFGDEKGIVYYTCQKLFKMFKEKNITYEINCCLLEIYNEQVSNLLPNNKHKVEVLENENKDMVLQHAERVKVKSAKQLINLVEKGAKSRHIAENFSNKRSSRSHMIVLLEVGFLHQGKMKLSKLAFLDLAGSERVVLDKKDLLLEGANINRSLLALTNCISILSEKKSNAYVPFRDSKLTRILKDFMNKDNVIKFLVCLKQEKQFLEESLITLNYAFKAQKIEKKKNLIKLPTHSITYYKHKIHQLEKELKLLRMKSSSLRKKNRRVKTLILIIC
jgi:kinesin family protein 18/19